jgi:hypothetical protein
MTLMFAIGSMVLLALFVGGCLYIGLRYSKHLADLTRVGYQIGKPKAAEKVEKAAAKK